MPSKISPEKRAEYGRRDRERNRASYRRRQNAYYQRNKEACKRRMDERYERRMRFLNAIKQTAGCLDCGTTERRLDFDHRDKSTKTFSISPNWNRSLRVLLEEIAKCDVRCVVCHALRHAAEKRAAG